MVIGDELQELRERIEKLEEKINKITQESKIKIKTSIKGTEINVGELTFLKSLKSVLDKCLALLNYVFEKDPNHSGLTPDEIVSIFREKFSLPIPLPSISGALSSAAGIYVTRIKIVQKTIKYRYQILPKGQEYVKNKLIGLNQVQNIN